MLTDNLAQLTATVALSIGEYSVIRGAYEQAIRGSITEYLFSDKVKITTFKNQFRRAIVNNFADAFEQGYIDGGSELPYEQDDRDWLESKIEAEFGFVAELFVNLKDFKKEADKSEYEGEAASRAEGYCRTLDGVYGQGKVRGAKDILLYFGGNDGKESCSTCQKLKAGAPHKASYWRKRDLLIYRGNGNYECGCWECQHYFYDSQGNIYTF